MKCPQCEENDNLVLDTYDNFMLERVRRLRLCEHCGCQFETEERVTRIKKKHFSKDTNNLRSGHGKKQ